MERILATALGQDVNNLAAQEKRLLLSRLLARFAHEVRNPLSSLHIHVQLLEEDLLQAPPHLREKAGARLEIIHGELHRLESIVRQFLSLSGPASLDLHPVQITRVLTHVRDLLLPEAAARGIELGLDLPGPLPEVPADEAQLTQALVNLVINAIQAVERNGAIHLTGSIDTTLDALLVSVSDNGPGIPPERHSAIFEPYYTTKPEGTGLGLWIVQQIITAHGGAVQVASETGRGARFSLHLPLRTRTDLHG